LVGKARLEKEFRPKLFKILRGKKFTVGVREDKVILEIRVEGDAKESEIYRGLK
jgi:hypothetical protein